MSNNNPGDATLKMMTLSERLNGVVKDGYTENFKVSGKVLASEDGNSNYKPNDITIANFYRFEGYSDPEDSSILYVIETIDGKKGTLIDAYGAYADAKVSDFIRELCATLGRHSDFKLTARNEHDNHFCSCQNITFTN